MKEAMKEESQKMQSKLRARSNAFYKKGICNIYDQRLYPVSQLVKMNFAYRSPLQDRICTCWSLNHPQRITEAIRKEESNVEFLDEGLIATYPLPKLAQGYSKFYKQFACVGLHQLTVKDVVPMSSDKTLLADFCFNDDKNPGLVVFLFPVLANQHVTFEQKTLPELIDALYVYGYNFSQCSRFTAAKRLQINGNEIEVMTIQFEAKFSDLEVELSSSLFHVSPSRYFDKIVRNGLSPYAKSDKMDFPERVYLFNVPEDSLFTMYGKRKLSSLKKNSRVNDDGFCIFKVKKSKLESCPQFKSKRLVFYYDPCYVYPKACIHESKAIFTYGNIPRSLLEDECLFYEVQEGMITNVTVRKI